jgi:hypothetical protein
LQRVEQQSQCGAELRSRQAFGEQHERRFDPRRRLGGDVCDARRQHRLVGGALRQHDRGGGGVFGGAAGVLAQQRADAVLDDRGEQRLVEIGGDVLQGGAQGGRGAQADAGVGQGLLDVRPFGEAPCEGELPVLTAGLAAQPRPGAAGGVQGVQLPAVQVEQPRQGGGPQPLDAAKDRSGAGRSATDAGSSTGSSDQQLLDRLPQQSRTFAHAFEPTADQGHQTWSSTARPRPPTGPSEGLDGAPTTARPPAGPGRPAPR